MTELAKPRPEFRNIHALKDLPTYRLPAAGWVSILHRISGVLMFLLMRCRIETQPAAGRR